MIDSWEAERVRVAARKTGPVVVDQVAAGGAE